METEAKTGEEALQHYGILGMRWGVRRTQAQLDRAAGRRVARGAPVTKTKRVKKIKKGTSSKKGPPSDDAQAAKDAAEKAKKSGVQSLTNQELQQLNNRLNLEQNYDRLTTTPQGKGKVKKGHEFVKEGVNMAKTANEIYKIVTDSPIADELKKK